MADNSKIEWVHSTFNPWIGCTKVHAGCTNCYAEADMDKRRKRVKWGPHGTRSVTSAAYWHKPHKWNKEAQASGEARRVFPSLCDPFEDWEGEMLDHQGRCLWRRQSGEIVAEEHSKHAMYLIHGGAEKLTMQDLRANFFTLIDSTPHLTWILLTKRPENVRRMWPGGGRDSVWLLYSASDQPTLDAGITHLLNCRDLVPVLGVSAEPLLSGIDFSDAFGMCYHSSDDGDGIVGDVPYNHGIDWVIAGHESGPNRRPGSIEDTRDIARQCAAAGVLFFNKQMQIDGKLTHDIEQFPADLRVRQMPQAQGVQF